MNFFNIIISGEISGVTRVIIGGIKINSIQNHEKKKTCWLLTTNE